MIYVIIHARIAIDDNDSKRVHAYVYVVDSVVNDTLCKQVQKFILSIYTYIYMRKYIYTCKVEFKIKIYILI